MVDMEAGLQGYRITADPSSLCRATRTSDGFSGEYARLRQWVFDDPAQLHRVAAIEMKDTEWQAQALGHAALRVGGADPDAAAVEKTEESKMGELRALFRDFRHTEEVRRDRRAQEAHRQARLSSLVLGGLLVVGTSLLIVFSRGQLRTVSTFVSKSVLRMQAEREASLEASIRLRDDFLAIAGHELNTPLAALLLQIQSLQRAIQRRPAAPIGERLDKAVRSGQRMQRLIGQLLDVSKIAAGKLDLEPERVKLGRRAEGGRGPVQGGKR